MEKSTQTHNYRNLLAVVAGIICTFLTGFILFPVVSVIFDKYFHFMGYPNGNEQRDGWIISITLIFWFFIPSMIGGFVCTLIAKDKEWFYVFLSMIIFASVLAIALNDEIFTPVTLGVILLLLLIPTGNIAGKLLASRIKGKRLGNKQNGLSMSDTPASPTDTAAQ